MGGVRKWRSKEKLKNQKSLQAASLISQAKLVHEGEWGVCPQEATFCIGFWSNISRWCETAIKKEGQQWRPDGHSRGEQGKVGSCWAPLCMSGTACNHTDLRRTMTTAHWPEMAQSWLQEGQRIKGNLVLSVSMVEGRLWKQRRVAKGQAAKNACIETDLLIKGLSTSAPLVL